MPTIRAGKQRDPLARISAYLWADHDIGGSTRTDAEAIADARRFDLIVGRDWNSYTAAQVTQMRAANPGLTYLVYANASFESNAVDPDGTLHPADWYATTTGGQKLQSAGFGNWLMNPAHPGWVANRVTTCADLAAQFGAHGVFLDMLTDAPLLGDYVVTDYPTSATGGIPANSDTGQAHTTATWYADVDHVAQEVQDQAGFQVAGNSLGRWADWPASAQHYDDTTIGWQLSENWLRGARAAATEYPTEAEWLEAIEQVSYSGKGRARFLGMNKLWTTATATEQDDWWEYSISTLICGWSTLGDAVTFYRDEAADPLEWLDWFNLRVGLPTAPVAKVGGAYQRTLDRGLVLVNPSDVPVDVTLPAGNWHRARTGSVASASVTVEANGAHIYREG